MNRLIRKASYRQYDTRSSGQAMVEFALVLTLLLVMVLGVLEVGRAIFMYAAVTNASREASRYGSAVGMSDAGLRKYRDCAGIRNVAKQTGFLLDLQDEDIEIAYHLASGAVVYCDAVSGEDPDITIETGDRVEVAITVQYEPLVPLINIAPRPFVSSSARTILDILQIQLDDDD